MTALNTNQASRATGAGSDGLLAALNTERKLMDELLAALQRQRDAVSDNDIDGIEACVADVHRTLLTLSEALKCRRTMVGLISGSEDTPLSEMHRWIDPSNGLVDQTVRGLTTAARTVARELVTTRAMLQGAIAEGDAYLKTLAGAELEGSVYKRSEGESAARNHAVLIDQQI